MLTVETLKARYTNDRWGTRLGVEPLAWRESPRALEVSLPYRVGNMNMSGRTHGGMLASFLHDAAKLLVWGQSEQATDPLPQTLDFQISYLTGGGREALTAVAELSRRTREFSFAAVEARNEAGTAIARAHVVFRNAPSGAAVSHPNQPEGALPALPQPSDAATSRFAPMVKLFNQAMGRAHPGCITEWMGDGLCLMRQEIIPEQDDWAGQVAPGQILTLLDNTGGGAGCSLATDLGMAVTLSIQTAFCEPAAGEALVAHAQSLRREDGLTHNLVQIFGADSLRLKAFGTMTHLVRPAKR
ncbi:MAG: acyl-CoA thioesterase domain-containing protein [Candidatus Macondimonas sp.]